MEHHFNDPYEIDDDDYGNIEHMWIAGALEGIGGIPDFLLDADFDQLLNEDYYDNEFFDDFDDSEDDYYDGYEEDLDHNKIFVSLHDSNILRRLCFHKVVGRCRLPRIREGQSETYESIFHVLEEIEILLKVWHKRTQHPFTAHLERNDQAVSKNISSNDEDELKFGVDYSDRDMEHESDDEFHSEEVNYNQLGYPEATEINETLSKKKFCHSTKLFYQIFESEQQFNNFLLFIRQVKKYIFQVIFSLFRGILPGYLVSRLPNEIWEKIWRYTQDHYCETQSLHVGTKHKDEVEVEVEKERITNLFGSAGNMHMMLFEILFKNPYITEILPLVELQSLPFTYDEIPVKRVYSKWVFESFKITLEKDFNLLKDFLSHPEETVTIEDKDLLNLIDQGRYFISQEKLKGEPIPLLGMKEKTFIFPEVFSDVIGFLETDGTVNTAMEINIGLFNVKQNRKIGSIKTGLRYLDFCKFISHDLLERITLTNSYFGLIFPLEVQGENVVNSVFYWHLSQDQEKEVILTKDDAQVIKFNSEDDGDSRALLSCRNALKASEDQEGRCTLLVVQEIPAETSGKTVVQVFDASTAAEIPGKRSTFDSKEISLEWFKGQRYMLRDRETESFLFCGHDHGQGNVISKYFYKDLCRDADHKHGEMSNGCRYHVKVDHHPERKQFVIFCQHFNSYQLFSYDEIGSWEDDMPEVIASGCTHVFNLMVEALFPTSLVDGVLFGMTDREVSLRAHTGDFFIDDSKMHACDIFALDCTYGTFHPIISLPKKEEGKPMFVYEKDNTIDGLLLNEQSRLFHLSLRRNSFMYIVDSSTIAILNSKQLLTINFASSAKTVIERDMKRVKGVIEEMKAIKEAEERKRKEAEAAKHAKQIAKDRFVNSDNVLEGKVVKWRDSFGFIKPFGEEAKDLGDVFFHISDVKNRPKRGSIRIKTKVQFKIVSQSNDRIKAVEVSLLNKSHVG